MKRIASAHWVGKMTDGRGTLTTSSGALSETRYSFAARFKNETGTNPEELVAAAHAGCFAMALSGALEKEGFEAISIKARATVQIEKEGDAWTVTSSHIDVHARVPGLDPARFQVLAEDTKATCPISRLLNVPVSLNAELGREVAAQAEAPADL